MERTNSKSNTVKNLKLYEAHKNIIHHFAWKHHGKTHLSIEDLIAEGNLIFMRTVKAWRKARTKDKLSSWLYRSLHHKLQRHVHKNDSPPEESTQLENVVLSRHPEWNPAHMCEFNDALKCLSADAKTITNAILNSPQEVFKIKGTESGRTMRGKIRKTTTTKWSWSKHRIGKVMLELRSFTNEART